MGERIVVSGSEGLSAYPCPQEMPSARIALEGAGALCAAGSSLYVACDRDNTIWRLSSGMLVPTGLFAGGPGVCQMLLSQDGEKLYALCSEADSLLMLSAESGAPLVVNRVGVNPCAMAMDEQGEVIAVAGGACGEVVLLSAHSLSLINRLQTPGVVFGAAICAGAVYALSLSETMDSVLTVFMPGGRRAELPLEGMPGMLAVLDRGVAAATHKHITLLERGDSRIVTRMRAPGRAGRLLASPHGLLMTDVWSDSLFVREAESGRWRLAAHGARDVALI